MADQKCDCSVSSAARALGPDQCTGETELTLAVRTGRADLVRKLLEGGASPLDTNGRDESPLLLGNYFHGQTAPIHSTELEEIIFIMSKL